MWDKKDRITELPQGIEYSRDTQELNLTYTNVDMIPRGLKGVKGVKMLKVPTYIASDFSGDVYVNKGSGTFEKLSPIEIYKAKFSYMQDSGFVESLRYAGVASLELAVLPSNMRFYEKNGKAYLDLSKTSVGVSSYIAGVDEVIMPRKSLFHKRPQMVHSKPKIYE